MADCGTCQHADEHGWWGRDGSHCHDCHRDWWGTQQAHCKGCHEHFNSPSSFNAHRQGDKCIHPEHVAIIHQDESVTHPFVLIARKGGPAWALEGGFGT